MNLDSAIRRSGVPRGSAYRLWTDAAGNPQEHYRRSVLLEILRNTPTGIGFGFTVDLLNAELAKYPSELASGDPDQLWEVARAMIRVVGGANFAELFHDQKWHVYRAMTFSAATRANDGDEVMEAVIQGEKLVVGRYGEMFAAMAEVFSFQLCEPYELSDFMICAYALNDGLAASRAIDHRLWGIKRPTGPGGAVEEWSLFSVALEALVEHFFEPIPRDGSAP